MTTSSAQSMPAVIRSCGALTPRTDPFHCPLTIFSYLAAITERIELVSGVIILPQRQTALVAKQTTDIDLLSGGRLRLGVGTGWNYVEYEALGEDFKTRGRRLSEQIGLLREYWTNPLFTFHGEFDHLTRGNINLRPKRQIPIWMGGFSEPAFRRAAEQGEGFIYSGNLERALGARERVEHHLAANGRADDEFGHDFVMTGAHSPADAAESANGWRDAGGTHATVVTMNAGLEGTTEAHLEFITEAKRLLS